MLEAVFTDISQSKQFLLDHMYFYPNPFVFVVWTFVPTLLVVYICFCLHPFVCASAPALLVFFPVFPSVPAFWLFMWLFICAFDCSFVLLFYPFHHFGCLHLRLSPPLCLFIWDTCSRTGTPCIICR